MQTEIDLDAAIAAGLINEHQALALRNFEAVNSNQPTATSEKFQLYGGLNDIMAASGLAMILLGVFWLALSTKFFSIILFIATPILLFKLAKKVVSHSLPFLTLVIMIGFLCFPSLLPVLIFEHTRSHSYSNVATVVFVSIFSIAIFMFLSKIFWIRFRFPMLPAAVAIVTLFAAVTGLHNQIVTINPQSVKSNLDEAKVAVRDAIDEPIKQADLFKKNQEAVAKDSNFEAVARAEFENATVANEDSIRAKAKIDAAHAGALKSNAGVASAASYAKARLETAEQNLEIANASQGRVLVAERKLANAQNALSRAQNRHDLDMTKYHNELAIFQLCILFLGVLILIAATWYDISDIRRETERSQIAFWLHCVAGCAIAQTVLSLIFNVDPMGRGFTSIDNYEIYQFTLFFLICCFFVIISSMLDRRSLIVSAALPSVMIIETVFGLGLSTILVGMVLLLLTWKWVPMRSRLLAMMPPVLAAQLPRTDITQWGQRPTRRHLPLTASNASEKTKAIRNFLRGASI
jgi:hypothetical protein